MNWTHLNIKNFSKYLTMLSLFSAINLFFVSCGKNHDEVKTSLTLNLSEATNKSLSNFYPIAVYLHITGKNNAVLFNGFVPLNPSGVYTQTPTIPLSSISSNTNKLKITGYYMAQLIQPGGDICNYSGKNKGNSTTSNNEYNSIYVADLTENPIEINLSGKGGNETHSIQPKLSVISYDKFALTIKNKDGSLATANYSSQTNFNSSGNIESTVFTGSSPIVTSISFVDNNLNKELIDPCTGLAFSARTDSFGRITTNFPLYLSKNHYFKIKLSQFSVESGTSYSEAALENLRASAANTTTTTIDLVKTPSNSSANSCSFSSTPNGTPPTSSVVNANGIPIFWNLSVGSATAVQVDPSITSYLQSSEILSGGGTTICSRMQNNFNPRFPDFPDPTSLTTQYAQYYLRPMNPLSTPAPGDPFTAYSSRSTYYNPSLENDLQLVNSNAFRYMYLHRGDFLGNHTVNSSTTLNNSNNYVTVYQNLKLPCYITYTDSSTQNLLGSPSQFADCTTFGYTNGLSGIAQYIISAGIPLDSSNPLDIYYYFSDSEDYLIYTNRVNNITLSGSSYPTKTNLIYLKLFNGDPTS